MVEKNMKKRLQHLVLFTVLSILCLFVAGLGVTNVFIKTFHRATKENVHKEADNYKTQIERQININFQMLDTLATTVSILELEHEENFQEVLRKADTKNDFLMFGYFDTDESGYMAISKGKLPQKVKLSETQHEVQSAVRRSMSGEKVVTDSFIGNVSSKKVFLFSVPVYRNEEVVGVLLASDEVEVFAEVLSKKVSNDPAQVHLVSSNGTLLICDGDRNVNHGRISLFENEYLSREQGLQLSESMKKGEEIEFTIQYKGREIFGLLEPLETNGWYLLSVNSMKNANKNSFVIAYVVVSFSVLLIGLFFFSLFYGYRMMRRVNEQLEKKAYYDEVTGIYNMRRFISLAEDFALESQEYTIVVLNIRRFRFINEIFGREQADHLLCYIAATLESSISYDEFVCRENADTFIMFMKTTDYEEVKGRVSDILYLLTEVKTEKSSDYQLMMRCGVAIAEPGINVQTVINHAMFALARSRKDQSNQKSTMEENWFFNHVLHEQEQLANYIESNAKEALVRGEFKLFLQPKIQLESGKLTGAEALVRWVQPDQTTFYPGSFIPIFESNGFCIELDMYMFELVCKQIREWIDVGEKPIPISINQCKVTFFERDYEEQLCAILEKYQVSASMITLEILEGMVLEDIEKMNMRLERLREIGFLISMDDFGTGYSSLKTLGQLKINEVKFDRGFLLAAVDETDHRGKLVMEELVLLSKKLNISTVIEGIETTDNECFARSIGCDQGQGYLYSRPVSAEVFTEQLLSYRN